jgi:hypothetical protein
MHVCTNHIALIESRCAMKCSFVFGSKVFCSFVWRGTLNGAVGRADPHDGTVLAMSPC